MSDLQWIFTLFSSSQVSVDPVGAVKCRSDESNMIKHEIQMKRRKKISRNHRSAENKKTERKMEDRNETQTSESREENRETLDRCESMERIKPTFSCDPDGPVKFDSDVKTEERFSSNPSSCSQEHTTSLTSISS
ncbi:uncharacterized protein LOC143730774 [Siphateles boraxobius]|uniref:uncharacterized protein LOC143730774 n=1 Tax=Siphateles boraxobius TaxID=180520 RepID=UPI004064161D